jgi:hypothetical protein
MSYKKDDIPRRNNPTLRARWIFVLALFQLTSLFVCFGAETICFGAETNSAALRIKSAHYASIGWCRFGITGQGTFLNYSFGRTNSCVEASFEMDEGSHKVLCVTNAVVSSYRGFKYVKLYYDASSRQLFKIAISRKLPTSMNVPKCIELLKSLSEDCYCWYGITVPVPLSTDIAAIQMKHSGVWSKKCEDESFAIVFLLEISEERSMNITLTIESKRVRKPRLRGTDANEVKVYIDL